MQLTKEDTDDITKYNIKLKYVEPNKDTINKSNVILVRHGLSKFNLINKKHDKIYGENCYFKSECKKFA